MEPILVSMFGVREGHRKERKGVRLAAKLQQSHSGCVVDEVGFGDAHYSVVEVGHMSS